MKSGHKKGESNNDIFIFLTYFTLIYTFSLYEQLGGCLIRNRTSLAFVISGGHFWYVVGSVLFIILVFFFLDCPFGFLLTFISAICYLIYYCDVFLSFITDSSLPSVHVDFNQRQNLGIIFYTSLTLLKNKTTSNTSIASIQMEL